MSDYDTVMRSVASALVADAPPPPLRMAPRRRPGWVKGLVVATATIAGMAALPILVFDGTGVDVAEPGDAASIAGTWSEAAAPPFEARSGAVVTALEDGRVLVWGGTAGSGTDNRLLVDGGIYDPETDVWLPIEAAPVGRDNRSETWTLLVEDRLAVIQTAEDSVGGAVLEVATNEWIAVPPNPAVPGYVDGAVWDGTTLAVVRLWAGPPEFAVTAPSVWRWSIGDHTWVEGTPPPLSLRFAAGVDVKGTKLVAWGGTEWGGPQAADMVDVRSAGLSDGAVYDLASDTWSPIPAGPAGGRAWPLVSWIEDGIVVSGGYVGLTSDGGGEGPELHATFLYEPDTEEWSPLPTTPSNTPVAPRLGRWRGSDGVQTVIGRPPYDYPGKNGNGEGPGWWYDTSAGIWRAYPGLALEVGSDLVVSTSETEANPMDVEFGLWVWHDPTWMATPASGFANRMDAGVALVGDDTVVVVGGQEQYGSGTELRDAEEVWVFRLD